MDKGSKKVLLDPMRAPVVKEMFERVAYEDWSGRHIHDWLVEEKDFRSKNGKRISLSTIYQILKETYYYGEFEFPKGGGVWYTGKHDPIITKELYLKAQANLQAPPRRHPGIREFTFTRLFFCGACGSGMVAEEKFRNQKSGELSIVLCITIVREVRIRIVKKEPFAKKS